MALLEIVGACNVLHVRIDKIVSITMYGTDVGDKMIDIYMTSGHKHVINCGKSDDYVGKVYLDIVRVIKADSDATITTK